MSGACYVDSSALLAIIYREPGALSPAGLAAAVTSSLCRVECLRTLERHRCQGRLPEPALLRRREAVFALLRSMREVDMDRGILDRAAGALSAPLKTLDAIHLTTALRLAEETGEGVTFATHDRRLAEAARAYGLEVVGV